MIFVKTFKGYEDKAGEIDTAVNTWILKNRADVVGLQTVLSHENGARAGSGDLLYTLMYKRPTSRSRDAKGVYVLPFPVVLSFGR